MVEGTKNGRVLVSVWLSQAGKDRLDAMAERYLTTRTDVIRRALAAGMDRAEADLEKRWREAAEGRSFG